MCLDAGIVRPAEIATTSWLTVATLAQYNLDQTSPLSFAIASTSLPRGRSRVRNRKEGTSWEGKVWESRISAVKRTLMWYLLRERSLRFIQQRHHMVGLKPNSFSMNYGSRQGPLQ